MRKFWKKQEEERPRREIQRPQKKQGCKIRFKKTATGEQIEFVGNCSAEQIEMAKRMRNQEQVNQGE